jgi:hypothetical protein
MTRVEIVNFVSSYLNQSLDGLEVENAKFDFKRSWYNLGDSKGKSEFLKDTSAIANTFGPDGFIVIGFDDKRKEFEDCEFRQSGLRDTSMIPDLINKSVDRLFTIDYYEEVINGKRLGILHIPPSIDKPHVIRSYRTINKRGDEREELHKIFVRKNSQTFPASKYDLDLMYYDRKNVVPEYQLISSFNTEAFKNRLNELTGKNPLIIEVVISIENTGRRPVSISSFNLQLSLFSDPSPGEILSLQTSVGSAGNPKVIQAGMLVVMTVFFTSNQTFTRELGQEYFYNLKRQLHQTQIKDLTINLTSGKVILSELTITR